jgi:hypothetical protein
MGRVCTYKGGYSHERASTFEVRSPRTSMDGARKKGRGEPAG